MTELSTVLNLARADLESRLQKAGVNCVIVTGLRSMGRDHFAVLVAEDDIARGRVATRGIPGVSVRFFTLSGAKSGGFRLDNKKYDALTLAVFPLDISDDLLHSASQASGLDALSDFRMAAYIQAYFGGSARLIGLATTEDDATDLRALASTAGVDTSVCKNRSSLDAYLDSIGWRPPIDMLERLGLADSWIHGTLLPKLVDVSAVPSGLTVFFCRARAAEVGLLDTMRSAIEDSGFEILHSLPLEKEVATLVRRSIRGGNWGAGPWPVNGGPPIQLLFAVDVFPIKPDDSTHAQHPFLDNARILSSKIAARDAVLSGIPSGEQFNPLHSADNSAEALRFSDTILAKDAFSALKSAFLSRRADVVALTENTTPLEAANNVSLNVRVCQDGDRFVRKIYRHQFLDNLQYDVEILELLAPQWSEVPALRKRGNIHLEIEDIEANYVPLIALGSLAPISTVLRLREILHAVAASGFDPVGWDPGQGILVAPASGDLKIPGFDRLQRWPESSGLAESLCLAGSQHRRGDGYWLLWYPILGIPRAVFVSGGPMTMRLYRISIYPLRRSFECIRASVESAKTKLRLPIRSLRRMLRRAR